MGEYISRVAINFNSPYLPWANTTLLWLNPDSEEQYVYNQQHRRDELVRWGWINTEIEYRFNSMGFRGVEFMEGGVMFLGCSFTFGIGVREEDLWTTKVSEALSLPQCNFGIGGASSDSAFRYCYGWIDKVSPKIVIFRRPPGIRLELVHGDTIHQVMINSYSTLDVEWLVENWAKDDMNTELNFIKNYLAIRQLCDSKGVKFIFGESFNPMHQINPDLGRDLSHEGRTTNYNYSQYILNLIS